MGKFANTVAGVVGTAIVTTNCFFAGTDSNPSIMTSSVQQDNTSNSVVSVMESAPSQTIDLSDYLSDVSDVVETAVEDQANHEEVQDDIETGHDVEVAEMTTGSAPPNAQDGNQDEDNEDETSGDDDDPDDDEDEDEDTDSDEDDNTDFDEDDGSDSENSGEEDSNGGDDTGEDSEGGDDDGGDSGGDDDGGDSDGGDDDGDSD